MKEQELKVNQEMEIKGILWRVYVNVYGYGTTEYFLMSCKGSQEMSCNKLFKEINRYKLQEEVLGYNTNTYRQTGFFPICDTLEDLSYFVAAIQEEVKALAIKELDKIKLAVGQVWWRTYRKVAKCSNTIVNMTANKLTTVSCLEQSDGFSVTTQFTVDIQAFKDLIINSELKLEKQKKGRRKD